MKKKVKKVQRPKRALKLHKKREIGLISKEFIAGRVFPGLEGDGSNSPSREAQKKQDNDDNDDDSKNASKSASHLAVFTTLTVAVGAFLI